MKPIKGAIPEKSLTVTQIEWLAEFVHDNVTYQFQSELGGGNYSRVALYRCHSSKVAQDTQDKDTQESQCNQSGQCNDIEPANLNIIVKRECKSSHLHVDRTAMINQEATLFKRTDPDHYIGHFWDQGGQYHYLLMAYLGNGELREKTNTAPCFRAQWFLSLLDQLLKLHKSGVVHRDIKPQNILLGEADNLHICDYGFACEEGESSVWSGDRNYMPPESWRTDTFIQTHKQDVYSLGITFLEMIFGNHDIRTIYRTIDRDGLANKLKNCYRFPDSDLPKKLLTKQLKAVHRRFVELLEQHIKQTKGAQQQVYQMVLAMIAYQAEDRPTVEALIEQYKPALIALSKESHRKKNHLARFPFDPAALIGQEDDPTEKRALIIRSANPVATIDKLIALFTQSSEPADRQEAMTILTEYALTSGYQAHLRVIKRVAKSFATTSDATIKKTLVTLSNGINLQHNRNSAVDPFFYQLRCQWHQISIFVSFKNKRTTQVDGMHVYRLKDNELDTFSLDEDSGKLRHTQSFKGIEEYTLV